MSEALGMALLLAAGGLLIMLPSLSIWWWLSQKRDEGRAEDR